MRGISDAQQSRAKPPAQAIHRNREQLDVVPVAQLSHASLEKRSQPDQLLAKCRKPLLAKLVSFAFGYDVGGLPVVFPVEKNQDSSAVEAAKGLLRIGGMAAHAHPQNIHGRAEIEHGETGPLAHQGMAPVRPYGQVGENLQLSGWSFRLNADNFSGVFDDLGNLGLHP